MESEPRLGPLAVLAVVIRPGLWREAVGAAGAMARRHWLRRRPHLPLPDPDYMRWRIQTAYGADAGSASAAQRARDLISYLEFRRELRQDR